MTNKPKPLFIELSKVYKAYARIGADSKTRPITVNANNILNIEKGAPRMLGGLFHRTTRISMANESFEVLESKDEIVAKSKKAASIQGP